MFSIEKHNLSDSSFRQMQQILHKCENSESRICRKTYKNDASQRANQWYKITEKHIPEIQQFIWFLCVIVYHSSIIAFYYLRNWRWSKYGLSFVLIYLEFVEISFEFCFENLGRLFWWPEGFIVEYFCKKN